MTTDTLERTFTCPESPQLILSNIRGSVVIRSGEAGIITVHAVKHIDSGDLSVEEALQQFEEVTRT